MKILHVIYGLTLGGAEAFLYNFISSVRFEEDFTIDVVIQDHNITNKRLEDLIKTVGKIHLIEPWNKNLIKHLKTYRKILNNDYDIIHLHCNSLINPFPLIISRIKKKKIIVHSHNSRPGKGKKIGHLIHLLNKKLFLSKNIFKIACSDLAGKWMFNSNYLILKNAVNLNDFIFNNRKYEILNNKYKLKNKFTIGIIGRFVKEKNHIFLVKVIIELKKLYPDDFKFIFIGDGELKAEIEKYNDIFNLDIIFTGIIPNVIDYYNVFDLICMPSLFEGFPFVAIEAQAAGIPVLASAKITKQINVTGFVYFLELEKKLWVKNIINLSKNKPSRCNIKNIFSNTECNAKVMSNILFKIYKNLVNGK